ncbi:aminomethyl-transferring glycine dehydrogenase subunit GcvPA [Bacillus sp. FJAT-44742]|uniref:aminomethyl-transferring glycine dehydrogenase subunit GcvPA n=1 Tax=Bacillus sp. FJAT-44742 TaxID=2014005 RepID=UPI000C23D5CB|nr:aminomethyl-transferring glycine dehydrogenase subunit GcvPA [Bacillus sp. FJAT-44742]
MKFRYLPMTEKDQTDMLHIIGAESVEELFSNIPSSIRFNGEMNLPAPLSEPALIKEFKKLEERNVNFKSHASFLGAGVYDHYIPSVVDHVIRRSEFYTAYTPYQPEISQGELQAIFEFQTMICELTGMDIANSSMYDGPTSLAEAAMMSYGHSRMKKKKVVVSKGIHPEALDVLKTYVSGPGLEVKEIDLKEGRTDAAALKEAVDDETACVIVQYPNFYGNIEDLKEIESISHSKKAMFVVSSNPLSLGVLTPPGDFGADIVVGDAQPFGIPAQMGGPHCGYFATTKKLMRKVPGRLVGQTVDEDGKRGFVLTLQAREQHIRRDKATSNICSNQALNALAASVAMSAIGKYGVKEMAVQNLRKAHYAKQKLKKSGIELMDEQPVFNEFVIRINKPVAEINKKLLQKGFIGGYDLGLVSEERKGQMLLCVTEEKTKEEIDQFVKELEAFVS